MVEGKAEGKVEGKAEGKVEGIAEGILESLIQVLTARFGEIPTQIRGRIKVIGDVDKLKGLIRGAASCEDLESFREALGE